MGAKIVSEGVGRFGQRLEPNRCLAHLVSFDVQGAIAKEMEKRIQRITAETI